MGTGNLLNHQVKDRKYRTTGNRNLALKGLAYRLTWPGKSGQKHQTEKCMDHTDSKGKEKKPQLTEEVNKTANMEKRKVYGP